MQILLVRHGHAGSKAAWVGEDGLRPLNDRGRAEAAALAGTLGSFAPRRIVSSPFVRCLQTVEPLGDQLGLVVEPSERLGPASPKRAVTFLRELATEPGPIVVCTHGEVIQVVQNGFPRRVSGAKASTRAKGSTWVLEYAGRRLQSARYLPAPRLPRPLATPMAGSAPGGDHR